jgi:hypothetical protein
MVMELCVAVDYSGLEAGVGIAKGYRGCHRDGNLTTKGRQQLSVLMLAILQPQWLEEPPIRLNGAYKASARVKV